MLWLFSCFKVNISILRIVIWGSNIYFWSHSKLQMYLEVSSPLTGHFQCSLAHCFWNYCSLSFLFSHSLYVYHTNITLKYLGDYFWWMLSCFPGLVFNKVILLVNGANFELVTPLLKIRFWECCLKLWL